MTARECLRHAAIPALVAALASLAAGQAGDRVRPVRNDIPQDGTELLVFRHQRLHRGGHEAYFQLSRDGVWPWFEKIGSRIVGQWRVIHPDGSPEDPEFDHGYRLARYASYAHWRATRRGDALLGGNGPDFLRSRESLRARNRYAAGSDGAHFLEGVTAATRAYFMPALEESYAPAETVQPGGPKPVRNDVNWPAPEIIALDRWHVDKGKAPAFIEAAVEHVWPYLEKVGARVVGAWKAVYPDGSGFPEDPRHDEVFMMVRYAGYEHWKAARPAEIVAMGGDGPDYGAYRAALASQQRSTRGHSITFLQGHMYSSPPKFLPGLAERYRRVE